MKTYTQSQIKEKKQQRRRLIASTFLTAVLHVLLFMLLLFFLPSQVFETPEEFVGPVYIELEDFPEVVPEIEETVEPTFTEKEETEPSSEKPAASVENTSPPPEETNTEAPGTDTEEVISPVENPEETIPEQRPETEPVKPDEPEKDYTENTSNEPEPEQSALDLSDLDRMLETEPDDSSGPAENPNPSDSDFSLTWEDAQNREAVYLATPDIPDWVSQQGLNLRVVISFTLVPQGFLISITLKESCGYTDVDTAVINAVRNWRFKAVNSTVNVKGSVTYYIRTK
jgi:TonB family protein